MKLDVGFKGFVECELYYTYLRERIRTKYYVEVLDNSAMNVYDNGDLYWRVSYIGDEGVYLITHNWCKTSDCWSIGNNIHSARRFGVIGVL